MFNFAYEQLQSTRKREAAVYYEQTQENVRYLQLTSPPKKAAAARLIVDPKAPQTASESPKKKRFGFFSSSAPSEKVASEIQAPISRTDTKALLTSLEHHSVKSERSMKVIQVRPVQTGDPDPSTRIAADKNFWQQMVVEVVKIAVPSTFSHPSCVEMSSDVRCCVVGTTSGEILVWDLHQQPAALLLKSHIPPPKSTKSSISRIALSANKTRIVTLNQLKVIHVWSLNRVVKTDGTQHSSDFFSLDDPQKWKPQPLELLMELNSDSPVRPGLSDEARQLIPTDRSSATVLPSQFLSTNWFSATSLLGEQLSVVCGISNGDMLKYNISATSQWSDVEMAAKFDAPTPIDLTNGLRFKAIKREFFCGHKHPVLFIKCLPGSKASTNTRLLSIDSDRLVLEWEYDAKHFSGFGWFTPVRRSRLDLQTTNNSEFLPTANQKDIKNTSNSGTKQGEILQIAATADERRVVLMVFFEKPLVKKTTCGRLVFYQLLLSPVTEPIQLAPVQIQLDFAGNSPPPRFALSTVFPNGKSHGSGHFLFVLMNNSVQILSLNTGRNCCALISLQQKSEPSSLVFNAISVSACCIKKDKLHCCMAVTGDRHNKILLYRFKQQHQR